MRIDAYNPVNGESLWYAGSRKLVHVAIAIGIGIAIAVGYRLFVSMTESRISKTDTDSDTDVPESGKDANSYFSPKASVVAPHR